MTEKPTRAGDGPAYNRQPKAALDPLMESYLDYMRTVERRAGGTIKDIRCTLGRVMREMNRLVPGKPLWELRLTDFLRFLEEQRGGGYSTVGLCKNVKVQGTPYTIPPAGPQLRMLSPELKATGRK